MTNFNPHELTTADIVNWIGEGDFEEAKEAGRQLAHFLRQLSENKEAQQTLMKLGICWIGSDVAKLISERLLDDPSINRAAQQKFAELIKAGHKKGSPELATALQNMRAKPDVAGKTTKSGAELFAKVLVPNKHTKRQFEARWIAKFVDVNIKGNSKAEFKRITDFLNGLIDSNNKIMQEWKNGERANCDEYSPAFPKRGVTRDQLEKDYRKFKSGIDAINDAAKGISRHRIKK